MAVQPAGLPGRNRRYGSGRYCGRLWWNWTRAGNADGDEGSDSVEDTNGHTCTHGHVNTNNHTYRHANTYANGDAHANTYTNGYTHANTYANGYAHANTYANSGTHTNGNTCAQPRDVLRERCYHT